ncbi:glucoamylase family protein [Paraliobacillus sp. JSM ZJ581]|uniref:glucoamylase family protein n=1 Tax=Paraliobacillus sp. JSM ZJ581 TaxID=3342118 RepID=UPI0035A8A7D1
MKKIIALGGSLLLIVVVIFFIFYQNSSEFDQELNEIAEDTYRFFENYTDPNTGLTIDRVDVEAQVKEYKQTSPTNIAMYLVSTVSAVELEIISKKEAETKIRTTLNTMQDMKTWNGLYYNWYYTKDGSLMTDWGQFISTVDNGWLTASLVIVGEYFPSLAKVTDPLIEKMDYSHLYDQQVGQFRGGYDVEKRKVTDHHYGLLYSETRLASYVAIGKGDVPSEHWWKLERALPAKLDWQSQEPSGKYTTYDNYKLFQGYYVYDELKYVPSWGGSMFEALMPTLFIHENKLGTDGLGLNNLRHVQGQIKFANEKGYEVWGFSPAGIVDGYHEFGVPVLGVKGYADNATVTPHASILAIEHAPEEVFKNLNELEKMGAYGDYGFYDSININTGEVAKSYLSLDQGMIMIALVNFLEDEVIRDTFHNSIIGKKPESLLREESFDIR